MFKKSPQERERKRLYSTNTDNCFKLFKCFELLYYQNEDDHKFGCISDITNPLKERSEQRKTRGKKETANLNQSTQGYWMTDILFWLCICVNRKGEKSLNTFKNDVEQI